MKRFYKETGVAESEGGWEILLDGKRVRSPAKAALVLPTQGLAEAVAAEWRAQESQVRPATMPLMRLASIAVDIVARRRAEVVAEVAKYAETDLVCYRAEHPPELVQRQQASWQPLVDWVMLRFDAPLHVTTGVIPTRQAEASLKSLAAAIAAHGDFALTGLHAVTTAAGSVVIGLALLDGQLDATDAFELAQLDESWEIEQWGEDAEATDRRGRLRADIAAAARFLALLGR